MSDVVKKRRVKRGWMKLRVTKIEEDNPSTKTLHLVNEEEDNCAFDYIPGQYLTFRFDSLSEKPVVRSYTMSSSPCQTEAVAVTVREVEDPFISKHLCREVKEGDTLKARGPIGRFVYEPKKDHDHLVMVAGGSGVTPFVSIMREYSPHLGNDGFPRRMTLFVTFRSDDELMCWEDLEKIKSAEGCDVIVTLSRQETMPSSDFVKGRVNEALLEEKLEGNYHDKTYMTCGPDGLMNMVKEFLPKHGVASEHIKFESFD